MLEAERNRAIWERDRLALTVESLLGRLELLGRWTSEVLEQAVETVEEQFSRDGSATDAPKRSGTGGIWSRI